MTDNRAGVLRQLEMFVVEKKVESEFPVMERE